MRLGCLPYLNVKPLVYPFEHGQMPHGWELIYGTPAELANMLTRGEIDAAPVSSFATFVHSSFATCPGICIASDGPAHSVLLLSKQPVERIRSVAVDTSSLSAANMLRIVLAERWGIRPEYADVSPEPLEHMLRSCDAALIIGNPAMMYPKDGLIVLDLGLEWKALTGLPAVFALWAGKGMMGELVEVLLEAKSVGLAHLAEIAREESSKLGLSESLCYEYLSHAMIYDLDDRAMSGLIEFRRMCEKHGLIGPKVEALL